MTDPAEALQQAALADVPRPECLRLLGAARVGRIIYDDDLGPVALPVNFRMDAGTILFRVSPGSDMHRLLDGAEVSFLVDRLDDFTQTGWSVLVRGTASFVPATQLPEHRSTHPLPWARGDRTVHVRVSPTRITGRRLVDVPIEE